RDAIRGGSDPGRGRPLSRHCRGLPHRHRHRSHREGSARSPDRRARSALQGRGAQEPDAVMSAAPGALGDLRVIDCSRLIAGGVLATMLADLGADVINVENPRARDPLRTWSKSLGELWWKIYARGKRSITLNLTAPPGQALLRKLVKNADVLIENYVPGTFEKWGLGWEALSRENPRLVMVRVSGWARTDRTVIVRASAPWSRRCRASRPPPVLKNRPRCRPSPWPTWSPPRRARWRCWPRSTIATASRAGAR